MAKTAGNMRAFNCCTVLGAHCGFEVLGEVVRIGRGAVIASTCKVQVNPIMSANANDLTSMSSLSSKCSGHRTHKSSHLPI